MTARRFLPHHQFLQRLWPMLKYAIDEKVASKLVVVRVHRKWHLLPPDYSYPTGKPLNVTFEVLSASAK